MATQPFLQALALLFLAPFAVTLLLIHIDRNFRSPYLRLWVRSFAMLCAFYLCTSVVILQPGFAAIAASAVGGVAGSLQLTWLVWGLMEFARRKPAVTTNAQRTLMLIAAAGAVIGVARQGFFSFGLHALATAAVFVFCAISLRRHRGAGYTIPAAAFLFYAAAAMLQFVLIIRTPAPPLFSIAVAELIGAAILSLGIVTAVLEDQREAAVFAASQVEHLAYYDTLTGLPNRSLFSDRLRVALNHAQRHKHKLAILFLDVDRFKQINDSLGHTVGDRLLRSISTRIRGAIRNEDTVARFGGDEFTVLIHHIGKIEDSARVAQKILDALNPPIVVDEREFVINSSVGISIFPTDGTDGETLIRNADTAMYRAKDLGGSRYHFYAAAMNVKALETLEVESGIRRALTNDEFILYYQPLIDVTTGSVFGLEALLRWRHPQLGILRPDRFIPAAEHSGLIIPLGRWVLREACRQASEWHSRGCAVVVAVNLSTKQFQDPDLLREIRSALDMAGLDPQYLELEITEGNAMHDVEKVIITLRQLKALGVRIAIDDFGTGYSCLSYLKQFPIDTLKLDSSFVRDVTSEEDAHIALGVIALAHSLKVKVIAEGVETIAQLDFLREHACDRLQGYLFSRPMPARNFETFIRQKHALKIA